MFKLSFARVFAILIPLLILAGSSVPGNKIPKAFELTPDKLIHCAEYAVLGFFLFRWIDLEFRLKRSSTALLTLLVGSAFGILDESYQRLIPGRTPDVYDWVLDTIGVVIAIGISPWLWQKLAEIKKP